MSTGFSFGAKTSAPTFGTPTFGAVAPQPQTATPQFGFGAATTASQPAGGGFQFGATGPAQAGGGFGFGTTPAPAAAAPTTGFGFGTATPAAGTGLTFGTPASSVGGLTFGTPVASNTGLTFGTPAASTTGLTFGAPASTSGGLSFGTPASSSAGLNFGTTTSAPSFGFGTGTGPAAAPTGLSFGATPAAAPATGLSFGLATTSAPSTGFGLTSTAPPTFGSVPLATTLPISRHCFAGAPTTNTATLSFGVSSAPSTGLNFGFGTTTSTSLGGTSGLSFGLGAASTGTLTATTTTPAATSQQNLGLGGQAITTTTTQTKTGAALTTQKEVPPKEQTLPNEIVQTVESFKNHIKQQKIFSSDIARCSLKDFKQVEADIDMFNKLLIGVERELQKNRSLAEKLKYDTAKGLQNVEMAQRTQETPPGLQFENTAPMRYFSELVDQFEKEMHALKLQIESTDKYVRHFGQPASLTSQDLTLGMRRLHETFVALAGRLQSVHSQVESQKEMYLNIRKQLFNDNTNPFDNPLDIPTIITVKASYTPPKVASGPTPFNSMVASSLALTNFQSRPPPAYPGSGTSISAPSFGMSTNPLGASTSNTSLFGSSFGQPSLQFGAGSNQFQLQKPPTGAKRGKQ